MTSNCSMPIFRRGDAFSLTVSLTDGAGAALDLDPIDLAAQVYDKPDGTKLADLTVTAGATTGDYILTASVDASEWPDQVVTNIFDTSDSSSSESIWIKVVGQLSRETEPEAL